jgi:hypothetical protein
VQKKICSHKVENFDEGAVEMTNQVWEDMFKRPGRTLKPGMPWQMLLKLLWGLVQLAGQGGHCKRCLRWIDGFRTPTS